MRLCCGISVTLEGQVTQGRLCVKSESGPDCPSALLKSDFRRLMSLCGLPYKNKSDTRLLVNTTFKCLGDLVVSILIVGINQIFAV